MNTLVRIRGWITGANLLTPNSHIYEPEVKYTFRLSPEDYTTFRELEERIQEVKKEHYESKEHEDPDEYSYKYKDTVIDGAEICFESLLKPKLKEEFNDINHDSDLYGRLVQAVGHLRIHKGGNCYLTCHILEPAYESLNRFEPIDDGDSKACDFDW